MRVDPSLSSLVASDIQGSTQQVQTAIQQLASGQRVVLPSDDPSASAANLRSLAAAANVDRYTTNGETVLSQNQMADSVLSNVVTALNQAISLGTQGANGTLTSSNRTAIASQVQNLLQQVVSDANQTFNGAPLFAGTSSVSQPFVADSGSSSGYSYQGNEQSNSATIGNGMQISTGVPGDQIFMSSGSSVLDSLANLATALTSGTTDQIASSTSAIGAAMSHVSEQRVVYAGVANQIQAQETYLSQETVTLTSQQQQLTGVDTTTAIQNLTQAQTDRTALLAAAAKILPTSLMNYLNPGG